MRNAVLFFYFTLIISLLVPSRPLSASQPEARHWVTSVLLHDPTPEEINLLLNLLYFSYARSQATVEAQAAIAQHTENCQTIVNHCFNSRLNPAHLPCYEHEIKKADSSHAHFINAIASHQTTGATYARSLEYILDNHMLNDELEELITELRHDVRIIMVEAIGDEVLDVKQAFANIKKLMNSAKRTCDYLEPIETTQRSLMELLWNISPYFTLKSFVQFDQHHNEFNKKLLQTELTSYTLGNIIWNALETARAQMYREHYEALYHELMIRNVDPYVFTQAFDHYGYLDPDERTALLPAPKDLR